MTPRNPSTVYAGRRLVGAAGEILGAEVTRDGRPLSLSRSLRVRTHSPSGFEWGYGGSGPAQLALALLLDALGDAGRAERWYQQFKWTLVVCWGETWSITAAELVGFVESCEAAERLTPAEPIEPFVVAEGGAL